MKIQTIILWFVTLSVCFPLSTHAGLVTGPEARKRFEEYQISHLDMFVDFENFTNGPYTKLSGLELYTTQFRWPRPIVNAPQGTPVILLPFDYVTSTPDNNRLMGAVKVSRGYIPDGQSRYEIIFEKCLDRVGLLRMWHTNSTTSFYQHNVLLAKHRNTSNHEFVGYIVDPTDLLDDCVTRVEFDGFPTEEQFGDDIIDIYQVGSVDDLFFSMPSVELDIEFDPNPEFPESPVITVGETIKITAKVKNIAPYETGLVTIFLEVENVKSDPLTINILPGQTGTIEKESVGFFWPVGHFKVVAKVYSPKEVLIDQKLRWIHVKASSISFPKVYLHILLLD